MSDTQTKERRRRFHIWHLEFRTEEVNGKQRDCYGLEVEYVIIAELEQQARFTAADNSRDGNRHYWLDPRWTSVECLGDADLKYQENRIVTAVYSGE
jgi:hypothetical protein